MSNLFENLQMFNEENSLLEMANMLGKNVKIDVIDFSFFFSSKSRVSHGIRVKVYWNRESTKGDSIDGYFELHGEYTYVPLPGSKKVKEKDIEIARVFMKKYKVLFAGVWENEIEESILQDYFRQLIPFSDILSEIRNNNDLINNEIDKCENLNELENVIRKYNIFNMND